MMAAAPAGQWLAAGPTARQLGEFGLIDALREALPPAVVAGPGVAVGIGDDCAIWTPPPGESVVVTTDSLVEAVHFRTDWTDPERLGHKALAVNLSDLASMGAKPRVAVVTLGLRGDEPAAALLAMYRGLGALAEGTGIVVAGGDIVRSPQSLTLHVTAIGETRGGRFLTRSDARPGDVIGVSGTIGAAAAGLALLLADANDARRQAATADVLLDAHLRPEPRLALGAALLADGATAAMDLSDGLLGDLPKMLAASGVAARLDAAALPVAAAVRALFPERWRELALRGGEDYELLFTAPAAAFARIATNADRLGVPVTAIGEIMVAGNGPRLLLR
ncbi:MAG TPA: thiamine-phosphate kinase, partial [Thermomicrobiales bacterium]|nr:thiamine-phosphate kinase [Thermomicrobiales bacterium]